MSSLSSIETNLVACIPAAWPGKSAASLAKQAAARYLLEQPAFTALSSKVAHAVRHECGGSLSDMGVHVPFRQLLAADPCFIILSSGSASDDPNVKLSAQQMLLRASASCRQSSSAQHLRDASAPRSATTMQQSTIMIRVKQTAAEYLLAQPRCRAPVSDVAAHVVRSLGSLKQLGLDIKFKQLLLENPLCFQLRQGHIVDVPLVLLTPAAQQQLALQLQDHHAAVRQQRVHAAQPAPPAVLATTAGAGGNAAPSGSPVTVAAVLSYARRKVWHPTSNQLDILRRALAVAIISHANQGRPSTAPPCTGKSKYMLVGGAAGQIMSDTLKAAFKGQSKCYSKISDALEGSKYLTLKYTGESEQSVVLDIKAVIRDIAQAAAEHDTSSNSNGTIGGIGAARVSHDDTATACTDQQPMQQAGMTSVAAPEPSAVPAAVPPLPIAVTPTTGTMMLHPSYSAAVTGSHSQLMPQTQTNQLQQQQQQMMMMAMMMYPDVTVGALLAHAAQRSWHSIPELDLLLWLLARTIISHANAGRFPTLAPSQQPADYKLKLSDAGLLLLEACRQDNGNSSNSHPVMTANAALTAAAKDAAELFSFVTPTAGQQTDASNGVCVQLHVSKLLQELLATS